jgi:hypothetical protein
MYLNFPLINQFEGLVKNLINKDQILHLIEISEVFLLQNCYLLIIIKRNDQD